jgi:hypothetical protein
MTRVAHWDEVEQHRVEGEAIAGRYQDLDGVEARRITHGATDLRVRRLGDAAGSVIARPTPAGGAVALAHSFVAGPCGLAVLAYGQRDSRDTVWYPRSRKLSVRAFGLRVRIDESLDPWDGEPS